MRNGIQQIPQQVCMTSSLFCQRKLLKTKMCPSRRLKTLLSVQVIVIDPHPSRQQTLTKTVHTTRDVQTCEILWCLKMVESHFSFSSAVGMKDLFHLMFPDSTIAKEFACSETKCRYLITFGLAPYFLQQLKDSVTNSQIGFALLFDESHNKSNKLKQMDFHLRMWDGNMVKTKYLTSEFLGHARAVDLFDKIQSVFIDFSLPKAKLLQLGMDGPAVNWNVYNRVHCDLKEMEKVGLIHTGSCGLHIVHNAFRAGNEATTWQVDSFLTAAYHLFKDSPARMEDFKKVTGTETLPLKFCSHRWLENVSVATHAIQILPSLERFVKAVIEKKIPLPNCKSFDIVKEGVMNVNTLIACRLAFFAVVAKDMEPFLTKYQKDEPLLPYMSTDLQSMLKKLMRRFLMPATFADCDTLDTAAAEKLAAIDISVSENYCSLSEIDIGLQAQLLLDKTRKKKSTLTSVSDRAVNEFKQDCRKFLKATVKKLLEKSPLKYSLVRDISCLDPCSMKNKQTCKVQMKSLLLTLCQCGTGRLDTTTADTVLHEFQNFLDKDVPTYFGPAKERLDFFFYSTMKKEEYKNVWVVVQKLLVLSHGQSAVERGFSFNREILADNLSHKALKARRVILDHIKDVGGVQNVISKALLAHCGKARNDYNLYLEDQRKLTMTEKNAERKRKIADEITEVMKKKKTAEEDSLHLVKEADDLAPKAQEQRSFSLIARSNQLCITAKDKQEEAASLQKHLNKLKEDLTSMNSFSICLE